MTKDEVKRNEAHDDTCTVPKPRPNDTPGIDSIGATVVNSVSEDYWNLHSWSNRDNSALDCLYGRANPAERHKYKFDISAIGCEELVFEAYSGIKRNS